jgi:hypothetical protein
MELLREKPYKVQANGKRGVKIRLPVKDLLRDGYIVQLVGMGDSLKILISYDNILDGDCLGAQVVFQTGTFFGICLPIDARRLTGLNAGDKFNIWLSDDKTYLIIKKVD